MAEDNNPVPAAQELTATAPTEGNPKPEENGGGGPLLDAGDSGQPDGGKPEGEQPLLNPEDGKKDEEQKPEGAPEKYSDFSLPEGFTLDEPRLADATALFKELNLPQAAAQKAVDLFCKLAKEQQTQQENELMDMRKQWRNTIQSRPDFREQQALARKGLRLLVKTDAQKKLFTDSWLQDSPELWDLFVTAGGLVSEDGMGKTTQAAPKTETEINMARFPNL